MDYLFQNDCYEIDRSKSNAVTDPNKEIVANTKYKTQPHLAKMFEHNVREMHIIYICTSYIDTCTLKKDVCTSFKGFCTSFNGKCTSYYNKCTY